MSNVATKKKRSAAVGFMAMNPGMTDFRTAISATQPISTPILMIIRINAENRTIQRQVRRDCRSISAIDNPSKIMPIV